MPRHARLLYATLAFALLALTPSRPRADEPSGAKGEMLFWIKDAEQKLVDLSEAVPEGKYSWRPSKGVRSVGEVYMHVAQANYGIPAMIGVKTPPEGFKFETYDKSLTKKADIRKALQESFASMESAFEGMSDADLEKPAEMFGMKTTVRGAYMLMLSHAHEHLGQSIAYARSNGIVPPWTAKQEAAIMKEKEKAASK